ncbi:thiamine kinase [Citrobacter amalonaticus]|uniref:Thiamine kinase n=1 Tax=Citrobacter amalonaticus TaxID=35703 RepID=A0A2S4RYN2_CITAM|nr:thiamine kinase [Citrobacter amalonaticus]POT57708.1 thiamine kinase [Citrobacter amalonaticus]POT76765.1 thiamine kinase [Citrobacter amalonaticus]POU65844.1 thiamine kinase [Citrobacter amalonaticus]POV06001.1 thiamine kinase [Citrobacter amalonaticus]
MLFNNNSPLTRDKLLSRYFPHYHPVSEFENGLSGGSFLIENENHRLVIRQPHDPRAPEYVFLRQYRALSRLPESLAPTPRFYTRGWMAVDYLPGEVKSGLPNADELAGLLYHLHLQPRFGWRIALLPLLERYWQDCDPTRRTPFWLQHLTSLREVGEPHPLRLAPLHMDVHAANLVHTSSGLRLIDWEYAGDGDIALELAAVWVENAHQHRQLVNAYAACAHVAPEQLWQQVRRWYPWLLMLKAGWFEYRWQQTGERQFIRLADETWRQLTMKG